MAYDSHIPLRLQLLRTGLYSEETPAIFAYTTSMSHSPAYFIASDATDIQGALEETLHALLGNGCTLNEACDVMDLNDLSPDDMATGESIYIDNGLGITGSLVSLKKLPLEDSDIHDLLSEQQIVNVRMAFDNLEPDDRLGAAERFAMGDYTGWQAQEVCKAYREHLPKSVIDTIADPKLTPGEMRALINIAALTEPSSDGVGVPQRPAFRAVIDQLGEVSHKLHLVERLATVANTNGIPFDERWCSLSREQIVSMQGAIRRHAPAEVLEAFSNGNYSAASMDCIIIAYCDGNNRSDTSALLNPSYTPAQLWCLSSALGAYASGDISDAQLDFLCNPELSADLMNAVRNCFTYYGLTIEQATQHVSPGVNPEFVYDLLNADADIEQSATEEKADERTGGASLTEEAHTSREASGHLEPDVPEDREGIYQEKE